MAKKDGYKTVSEQPNVMNILSVNKPKDKLNPKQRLFCELFASDREFFGNGVQSYIEAYGIDLTKKGAYNVAKANANRLLTKADILDCIDELFEAHGLNDTFVDKQLEKLIVQDAEFSTKLQAIKEYNALKQRITKKLDMTTNGKDLPTPILSGLSRNNINDDIIEQ